MNWRTGVWTRLQPLGFFLFVGVTVLAVVFLFLPLIHQRRSLEQERSRLGHEIARQKAMETEQKAEIVALRTDSAFVERTARDKLNLCRPNETIFRFETAPAQPE